MKDRSGIEETNWRGVDKQADAHKTSIAVSVE